MFNPVRTCIGCAQTDDHPRHVISQPGADVNWHMDCHKLATGCEICARQTEDAGEAKGDQLRQHLVSLPPMVAEEV